MDVCLEPYYASDRRVYYGAPCSDMQRELDREEALFKKMRTLDRTSSCTYFPVEGKHLVFTNSNLLENPDLQGPPRELTGNFHTCRQQALIEAITVLEKRHDTER
jgi:hypothetical protein